MPSSEFEKATVDVKNLKQNPTASELLKLYGLYKQATEGDNNGKLPSAFNFTAMQKAAAWTNVKGTNKEDAEKQYTALVDELKERYGFDG